MEQTNTPLVSMITYCFNGERFVHKYFEAILQQTYKNIELIFFDNGSKDRTYEIAKSYVPKLEAIGIQVQLHHYDENQSTCLLKQRGFQLMHGDYFFGCDSDDLIHPTYVEKMLGYLLEHPEKGIVFCQLRAVLEETGEILRVIKITPKQEKKAAFLDMLHARNTLFTPISHMISKKHYQRVNPGMEIHLSLYGENYQIQLPLLYEDLQGYLDEPLGDYSVRHDSYTGKLKRDPLRQIKAFRGQEENIMATLEKMQMEDRERYYPIFQVRLRKDAFYASLEIKDKSLKKECYTALKEVHGVDGKAFIFYHFEFVRKLLKKILRSGSGKE